MTHSDPPVSDARLDDYFQIGEDVRANLSRRIDWLLESAVADEGITSWELVIATLAWDVGGSALRLGRDNELRAARILNRSLVEYAFRLHHYVRNRDVAEKDYCLLRPSAQKMMRVTGDFRGNMNAKQFKAYRRFATAAKVDDPPRTQLHDMMRSMLENFGLSGGDLRRAMRQVEIEYSIGSGIVHGSESAIINVLSIDLEHPGQLKHSRRSPLFTPAESLTRTTLGLAALLRAMELLHDREMGVAMHLGRFGS